MMNIYWDDKLYERTSQVRLLNELLHKIHLLYSDSLDCMLDSPITESEREKGQFLLPVGLPSSGVLGNLLLVEFDENVWEKICPVYYGRYVDDMLFVFANRYVSKEEDDPVTEFVQAYFVKQACCDIRQMMKLSKLLCQNGMILALKFKKGKLF